MTVTPGQVEFENLRRLLDQARRADLGAGDVTSELLPPGLSAAGAFTARQELVVCGAAFLPAIGQAYGAAVATDVLAGDGEAVSAGQVLAEWRGPARAILAGERVALNFLQRLCGIATLTRRYVQAVAGTPAGIYDTRKTTPGWRALAKYAVRAGGGRNHRMGLYDAVLVKDNHLAALAAAGFADPLAAIGAKLGAARRTLGGRGFVAVEVDTLEQLRAALSLPVDVILLDNMSPEMLSRAAAMRNEAGLAGRIALEASGGVDLSTVRAVAEAGVERISVGALTHSAPAADVALDVRVQPPPAGKPETRP